MSPGENSVFSVRSCHSIVGHGVAKSYFTGVTLMVTATTEKAGSTGIVSI